MNIRIVLWLFLTSIMALNCLIDSKQFCDAFHENNNRISYIFSRPQYGDGLYQSRHDIVIDGYSWRLLFNSSTSGHQFDFHDNNLEGQPSPFFNDDYIGAISQFFMFDKRLALWAILFKKNDWTQTKIGATPNDTIDDELSKFEEAGHHTIVGLNQSIDPEYIFMWEKMDIHRHFIQYLICIEETINGLKPFAYTLDYELVATPTSTDDLDMDTIEKLYKNQSKHELVSIVKQYGYTTEGHEKLGFLLLFVEQETIKWCWTPNNRLDVEWCQNQRTTLIDCPDSKLWIYIAIITLVIIIIICIAFMALYLIRSKNKNVVSKEESQTLSKTFR